MRKLMYLFLVMFATSILFTGCREKKSAGDKIEDAVEDVEDAVD